MVTQENETYFMHFKRELLIVLYNCLFETNFRTRYFPENCYIVSKRQIKKIYILEKSITLSKMEKAMLIYITVCYVEFGLLAKTIIL